ncbi:MAG TPA: MFS transporter [Streptosporangiaceae bacterium]|jgi:MFS family permease
MRAETTAATGSRTTGADASWLPLVACCLGTFLLLLYTTIVNVSLPRIGAGLHAGYAGTQWIIDVYTLAVAGLLLGAGALNDVLGSKRVYVTGLAVFGLATLGCGLAGSAVVLIAARAAQGIAGAAMFAAILPLIGLTYTGRQRATAFAVWGAVAGAAGAVGTVAGGVLTEYAGWRWTFLGALPICAAAVVLAATTLAGTPRGAERSGPVRIDWPGIAAITAAVTGLAYALIVAGESGSGPYGTLAGLAVAAVAGTAFVLVERRSARPILPLKLFGTRTFVGVLLVAFGYYFAAYGALPAVSVWLQDGRMGSLGASLVLTAQLVVFVAVSGLVSARLHGLPPSRTLGGGTIAIGLGCLSGLALLAWPHWAVLVPFLILTGLGAGVVSPVFPAVAVASVPPAYAGTAGAAANSSRQLGLALGIAVCGTVYHALSHAAGGATTGLAAALAGAGLLALVCGAVAVRLLRAGRRAVRDAAAGS